MAKGLVAIEARGTGHAYQGVWLDGSSIGEWQVSSDNGGIVCEHVVNAAGTYARQVGGWVRLDVPITSMTHHYVVTDRVPEFQALDTELHVPMAHMATVYDALARFAYIAPAFAMPGTKLEVMMLGKARPARVPAEAVYDARNERPRG